MNSLSQIIDQADQTPSHSPLTPASAGVPTPYTESTTAQSLQVITRVAVMMLQSGATSSRTEDTLRRVAKALNVEHVDGVITPTGVIITVRNPEGEFTKSQKVPAMGVNMDRIYMLDRLSLQLIRQPGSIPTVEALRARLDEIEHTPPNYSQPLVILAVAVACGSFGIILGGGALEFIAAAAGAALAQWIRFRLIARHFNPFLMTITCAAAATFISYVLVHVLHAPAPRLGLIASVLLLVPGVPLVTALLDLIHLDLISGMARGIYALLILMYIGLGMLIVLVVTGFNIL